MGRLVVKGASLGLLPQPPIWHMQIIIPSLCYVGAHLEPITSRTREPCSCTWLPSVSRAPSAEHLPWEEPPLCCETPQSTHHSQVTIAVASLLRTGYQTRAPPFLESGHRGLGRPAWPQTHDPLASASECRYYRDILFMFSFLCIHFSPCQKDKVILVIYAGCHS